MKPRRHIASLLLFLLLAAGTALAQRALEVRSVQVAWAEGAPRLTFSASHLVDEEVRRELGSGLQKSMVVTVQAYREGGSNPIAARQYACAVTYDLWQDAYVVRLGRHTRTERQLTAVVRACLEAQNLVVGSPANFAPLAGRRVYFAVRAEFNPISGQRCSQLMRQTGTTTPLGPLVINIVRREICQAQRSVDFRSASVTVP